MNISIGSTLSLLMIGMMTLGCGPKKGDTPEPYLAMVSFTPGGEIQGQEVANVIKRLEVLSKMEGEGVFKIHSFARNSEGNFGAISLLLPKGRYSFAVNAYENAADKTPYALSIEGHSSCGFKKVDLTQESGARVELTVCIPESKPFQDVEGDAEFKVAVEGYQAAFSCNKVWDQVGNFIDQRKLSQRYDRLSFRYNNIDGVVKYRVYLRDKDGYTHVDLNKTSVNAASKLYNFIVLPAAQSGFNKSVRVNLNVPTMSFFHQPSQSFEGTECTQHVDFFKIGLN